MNQPDDALTTASLGWREIADGLWLALHRGAPEQPILAVGSEDDESPLLNDLRSDEVPYRGDNDRPPALEFDDLDVDNSLDLVVGVPSGDNADPGLAILGRQRATTDWMWSKAGTLPGELALGRAMRPLQKSVPSRTEFLLDEELTAERAAEDGLWLPAYQPAHVRAFDVVLVTDTSPSMRLWQRTAARFRSLLEHQGAFRSVRPVTVDTNRLPLALRGEAATSPGYRPNHFIDATGHRIALVITDGIGAAWRTADMGRLLAEWARRSTVAVVQVLPPAQWAPNGMTVYRAQLSTPRLGTTTERTNVVSIAGGLDGFPDSAMPVPVLSLEPRWFAQWSQLAAGTGPDGVPMSVLAAGGSIDEDDQRTVEPTDIDPDDRVVQFRLAATPTAQYLASLLAAAPLTMRTMLAVQRTLVPESEPAHLAEVLNSGLLRRTSSAGLEYEFLAGLRPALLATSRRADTARVLRLVADLLGSSIEAVRDLRAILAAPDRVPDPTITAENLPFVQIEHDALRALAGPFSARAIRLGDSLHASRNDDDLVSDIPSGRLSSGAALPSAIARGRAGPIKSTSPTVAYGLSRGSDVTATSSADQIVAAPRSAVKQPALWGTVPPRNVNFTGRAELLDSLRERLSEATPTAVLPEALHGLGGIGKSQIAVEYAYRHATDYDVVWWVPAEDTNQIQSAYVELAKRLDLPVEPSADTAVPAVREALRLGAPFGRWLLVFDNADRPEDVQQFFPAGGGHILVTSRNSQWSTLGRAVSVDVFTPEESRELLQRRNTDLADGDADRIAEALGHLPLAVEQASAWRAQTGMSTDEYLALFEDNRSGLLDSDPPPGYPVAVAAAWNVSLDRLRIENRGALELLQACAFYAPEPITRSLFVGVRNLPVSPALQETLRDPVRLSQAIRDINRYSLARLDHRTNTIQLHRLVQAVLRAQLSTEEQDQVRHSAHLLLANGDPNEPNSVQSWPRYSELMPHVRACQAMDCEDAWVRRLAVNTVVFLFAWGESGAARDMAQELVDYWRDKLGESHRDTLLASRWLARALRVLGQFDDARRIAERTLALLRDSLGDDHEDTLLTVQGVASDLRTKGDFAAARDLNEDAYVRARRVFGPDDPETLAMANNYALSLRLVGSFSQARKLDEDTWRRKSNVLGENHRNTLLTRDNWSVDLRETGDYETACRAQEDTVRRFREFVGPSHPMTLAAIKNLGVARRKAGDHHGAREMVQEALDGLRGRYGEWHPDAMSAAMNLSIDLRQTNDMQGARRVGTRARDLYEETWGPNHPYSIAGATNLAVTLRLLQELDKARQLDELALQKMRSALGENHPFALTCATNFASDLAAAGEFMAAYELDSDTLSRSQQVLGDEHPSTLALAVNLSLDLRGLDREQEATELQEATVAQFRKVLGPEHPATIGAMHCVRANCDIDPMQL